MTVLISSLKQNICHFVNIPVRPAPRELWRQQWLKAVRTGENACYTDLKSVIQNLCCWMVYTLIRGTICVDVGTVHTQSQERYPRLTVSVTGNKRWWPKKLISSEAYDPGGKKSLNLVLREATALTQSAVIAQRSHHRLLGAILL